MLAALDEITAGIGITLALRGNFLLGLFVEDNVGPFARAGDGVRGGRPVDRQFFVEEAVARGVDVEKTLTEEGAHFLVGAVADRFAFRRHEGPIHHHAAHVVAHGAHFKGHVDAVARAARRADRRHVDAREVLHHLGVEAVAAGRENDVLRVDRDLFAGLRILCDDARHLAVLRDELFTRSVQKKRAAFLLEELNHGLRERTGIRVNVPGLFSLVAPGGLDFLPLHAVVFDPLDRVAGEFDEGLDQGCVDAPVMVFGHGVEGVGGRPFHVLGLRVGRLHAETPFHEEARAAREGVLFNHDGLQTAFDGGNGGDRAARTGADHHDVGVVGLVGPGRKRHCDCGCQGEHLEFHGVSPYGFIEGRSEGAPLKKIFGWPLFFA